MGAAVPGFLGLHDLLGLRPLLGVMTLCLGLISDQQWQPGLESRGILQGVDLP